MRFSRHIFLLILILLLALVLRLHHLTHDSFWLDEILTVQLSSGHGYAHLEFPQDEMIPPPVDPFDLKRSAPIWKIWSSLDRDVHPPLFYIVLRVWREVVGDSDFRIRLLSVLMSLGAIGMLYLAIREGEAPAEPIIPVDPGSAGASPSQKASPAALWACLLMALAGPQIEYAQEMRSYMLLLIGLLIVVAGIVRIERLGSTKPRCFAIGAGILVALLTHYAAIPAVAAILIYVLIRFRAQPLQHTLIAFAAAAAIFAVAWGPFALEQMRDIATRIEFTAQLEESPLMPLLRAAELPRRFFVEVPIRPVWLGSIAALIYVIPAVMLRRRPELVLWWIWLIGYVALITFADVARSGHALEWIRYTLAASPPAYVLMAGMLGHLAGWKRHIVPAAMAIACVAALPAAYTRQKADWRELAEFFASRASKDDVMLFYSIHENEWQARTMYLCLRYYASQPALPVAFLSRPDPRIVEQLDERIAWVFGVGPDVPAQRLFSEATVVEMKYVPYAGTAARVRAGQRLDSE